MVSVHEIQRPAIFALNTGRMVPPLRPSAPASTARAARSGDVYSFGPDRMAVEVVIGFRPGIDRLTILSGPSAGASQVLLTTEEGGNAVVIDRQRRRVILQGVTLAEIVPGDIDIGVR